MNQVQPDSVLRKCQVPNGATHILIDHNQVFFFLKAKGEWPIRYYAGAGRWNLYPTRQLAERDLMSPRCLALPPPIEGLERAQAKFNEHDLRQISEALDLACDELHNQIATCPDVNLYAEDIKRLREHQRELTELKARIYVNQPSGLPPVDWEGYYTRKGGTRWFWCVVVAHDQGKAVIRTKSGHYHAHSPDEFEFSKEPEGYRV